jgi:hypothetical protein
MKWSMTKKMIQPDIRFISRETITASAKLASHMGRQFYRHVLPFTLMLLLTGWLTLKAGEYIHLAKQSQAYDTAREP